MATQISTINRRNSFVLPKKTIKVSPEAIFGLGWKKERKAYIKSTQVPMDIVNGLIYLRVAY